MGGEILNKLNLFIREWLYLFAINDYSADKFVFRDHWHGKQRPSTRVVDGDNAQWLAFSISRISLEIWDMSYLLCAWHRLEYRLHVAG